MIGMRRWHRYDEFLDALTRLGYRTQIITLDAASVGVPQSRRRLFIVCDLHDQPTVREPGNYKRNSAKTALDMGGPYSWSPLRTERRAPATLERADRAIDELGEHKPFLLVYYGSDKAGGWQRLDAPLRTITTLDRFAIVRPRGNGHEMRMLQVPELKKAMGMPVRGFKTPHGTRRQRIMLLGNAVCPPVMTHLVKCLTREKLN